MNGASPFINRCFRAGMKMMIPIQYFLHIDELCMPVDDLRMTEDARLLNYKNYVLNQTNL